MQYFSTDFPLRCGIKKEELLGECLNWIIDSPYTSISQEEILRLPEKNEFQFKKEKELLEYNSARDVNCEVTSLRYTKTDHQFHWITTISFLLMETSKEVWVNVKSTCESKDTSTNLPTIKKPVIIIRLIDKFGGGIDDDLYVNHNPFILSDDESGYIHATNLITGQSSNRLPIVYVSCGYNGRHALIPERIARKLSGLAHVIVEPSRSFSVKIRSRSSSRNVYGGVVGVYWPNNQGVTLHRHDRQWGSVKDFEEEIYSQISGILSKRMPLMKCTWDAVKDIKNRAAIERLKTEETTTNELTELYDNEINQKEEELAKIRSEVLRLESVVRSLQAKNPVQGGVTIQVGDEDDYFPNEIYEIVLDAIKDYSTRVKEGSRRQHIIISILESNTPDRASDEKAKIIKEALRGYREMNQKVRFALESCGFEIDADSRHWKITYHGDERYTYVLPKSGSDNRGGLNAGSDICGLIY
ncbi:hypothetical protein [Pseudomonas sp.]|uniref:hypothetical protein n=1 Tax=Pseudomonas sp. TaxID=306 RepID=UPI0027363CCF|nr:hypothetical protein [Pseudomonas sp.]MDP2745650.1 hypothetical protein [Pseudomonas sp.]